MINRVILVGRLTRDVELRKTNSGTSYTNFTLAVNRRVSRNNANSNQPTTDFISCVAWNQTADLMKNYLHKGSQIGVEGRIQTRNYDDPNVPGRKVYVTEVVADSVTFLESRNASMNQNVNNNYPANDAYYPDTNGFDDDLGTPTLDISSDDLPF